MAQSSRTGTQHNGSGSGATLSSEATLWAAANKLHSNMDNLGLVSQATASSPSRSSPVDQGDVRATRSVISQRELHE